MTLRGARSVPLVVTFPLALVMALAVPLVGPSTGSPAAEAQEEHGTLRPVSLDGLGNPDNYGFQRLFQFQGHLWMVAGNWNGTLLYRSNDGENWEPVNPPGFDGSPENDSMTTLAWFKGANDPPDSPGQLYASTYNFRAEGPFAGDIWRSANALADDPEDVVWEKVVEREELGDEYSDVQSFVGMIDFKDHLYVGTFVNNHPEESGSEIFRTKTGDKGDWHVVTPNGMDDPQCNTDFPLPIVFGDHLYYGSEEAGCVGAKGGEIWRTNGDDLVDGQRTLDGWEKVLEQPGFGRPYNNNIFNMDVFQDHFYGATWVWGGGMEVHRAPITQPHEGANEVPFEFEQVSPPGIDGDPRNSVNTGMVHLGDTLYVLGIDLSGQGDGYFFRTSGAPETGTAEEHLTTWTEITAEGFPPPTGGGGNQSAVPVPLLPLDGPYWLEVFKNKIYIAVEQGGHGQEGRGQLWVYEPNDVPDFALEEASSCVTPGATLTIAGAGFDDYQGDSYVQLAGRPLSEVGTAERGQAPQHVQKWTDTQIDVTIPVGSNSGALTVYKDGMTTAPHQLTVADDCTSANDQAPRDPSPDDPAPRDPDPAPAADSDDPPLPATGSSQALALLALIALWLAAARLQVRRRG